MRSLTDILRPFIHALAMPMAIWAIAIISYSFASQPSEATVLKQTLTLKQLSGFVRLNEGSFRHLAFTVSIFAIEGDQDIVRFEHFIQPGPGDPPAGIVIRSDYPPESRLIKVPKTISVNSKVTGVKPGRYTVITTAAVTDKGAVKARETFSTQLLVEVVKPGTPEPLVLNKPLISPSAIPPAPEKEATPVTFRTLVSGPAKRPEVLLLDDVSKDGKVIKQAFTELRDNGKGADHRRRFLCGRGKDCERDGNREVLSASRLGRRHGDLGHCDIPHH